MIEEINLLSVKDMLNTYIGYSHPHVSKRFDILDLIETRLIKHTMNG
jgi:hypothetical protein